MNSLSRRLLLSAVLASSVLMAAPSGGATALTSDSGAGSPASYAPLDQPGPPLDIPPRALSAALACSAGVIHARRDPILLVPGTEEDPGLNFGWNYERAFTRVGWPYCAVTLPGHTTEDIQRAGEYLVYAIRRMHALAGRRVDILGYSQGGMVPRWALRFWPDTRRLVNAFAALDPSNHGTVEANAVCEQPCSAADWQQRTTARFIQALNSRAETFAGISYTVIYSETDDVVIPNFNSSGSSSLHTGSGQIANIAVQQICPNDTSDHFGMGSYDAVGYALAVDAFTHSGPAAPSRISRSVCTTAFQPGVDPATFPENYANFFNGSGTSPSIPAEPPLAAYVYPRAPRASCPSPAGRLYGRSLGPLRLGDSRIRVRSRFRRDSLRIRRYVDFFCLAGGGGIRAGYPSPALRHTLTPVQRRRTRGRLVLALTASRHYELRGARPGARVAPLARRLGIDLRLHVGLNWWYLMPAGPSRGVLKVRRGVIEEIGIAVRALTNSRRAALRFFTSFG